MIRDSRFLFLVLVFFFISCEPENGDKNRKVSIRKKGDRYVLFKDGEPFYIKGAAGFEKMDVLKKAGGNTVRTWSCENADSILDEAHKNNLSVILGLFLLGERHGFDYDDEEAVRKQFDEVKKQVLKYKDHPALLMWGVGNEMDIFNAERRAKNLKVWDAVNDICKMIHETDPDHPTTTMVIPFRNTLWNINKRCPEIDILSINTFGELNNLASKLNEPFWGWDGPYLVSEWGTLGWWEVEKTIWDAPIEATTTKKAEFYHKNYLNIIADSSKCIGSCVFFWGQKQEKTPSWFSMFAKNGQPTEAVQIMENFWKGKKSEYHYPKIDYMLIHGKGAKDDIFLKAGEYFEAEVVYYEPENERVTIHWEILPDMLEEKGGGEKEKEPLPISGLIGQNNKKKITFKCPEIEGAYRLYVHISDPAGQTAISNIPFFVIE